MVPTLVVLAGGLGTRLRSVVADQPKILAPIGRHPYLHHLLKWAEQQGIEHMHFCLGFMAEKVVAWLQESDSTIQFSWQIETKQLGTGGAVKLALEQDDLSGADELLICNGDTFVDFSVSEFVCKSRIVGGGILTVHVDDSGRFGTIKRNESDCLDCFLEKHGRNEPGEINAGWYYFDKVLLEQLFSLDVTSLERDFLMKKDLGPILCVDTGRQFLDFGTPESYQVAQTLFKDAL